MTEQNFKPSLHLQVFRENAELILKSEVDSLILKIFGSSCQIELSNHEVQEWINEVEKISDDLKFKPHEIRDSFWCNMMILRLRKVHAHNGPNLTFGRISNAISSSLNMAPLSLREELYSEIASLVSIKIVESSNKLELVDEVMRFLVDIKILQLKENNLDQKDFGWYHEKIAEARALIAKYEPAFSLQSHDVGSDSSINMHTKVLLSLHEELRCEIRSLNSMKYADMLVIRGVVCDLDKYKKELQDWVDEVNKFLIEIKLQLKQKILEKNLDWYRSKIAESITLTAKRYLACPLRPQDVGYKEQYQIFLSFRGEDTREGFTNNLYNVLHHEGFKTFMDDRGLQRGDPIAQVLVGAIQNSKLSIIIFSTNFANSTWCLDEVVKIVECKKKKNQLVWPIFYNVEPSDVDKAMVKLETRFGKNSQKVENWRLTLNQVCGLDYAFHYKENNGSEGDFIQSILEAATKIRYYL